MKKLLLTAIASIGLLSVTCAQSKKLRLRDFNTWSVQANGSLNWGNMDIAENSPFYTSLNPSLGYGLRVNKFLTHNLSLSVDGFQGTLSGNSSKHSYDSKINYQVAALAQIQTGNIRFLENFKNLQLYAFVGYGTVNFTSKSSKDSVEYKMNQQVVPAGVGVKYRITNQLTANLEYMYNAVNSDYLDGYRNYLTNYDNYSRVGIGITYTLGKKDNLVLEWHDPRPKPTAPISRKDTVVVKQIVYVKDSTVFPEPINLDSLTNSINQKIEDKLSTTVYYEFNQYRLPRLYNSSLDAIAKRAIENKGQVIVIESYTDTIGSPENNKIVVLRRANKIKGYLIEVGFPESRIECILRDEAFATDPEDALNRKSIVYLK